MRIAGLQKNSTLDFPGLFSAVVFFAGCNYDCWFCHNAHLLHDPPLMDKANVLEFFERRAELIEGVVLSGGEPTLQDDLPDFARKLKRMGYRLKLDTNGSRPEMVGRLLREGLLDYVAMDYKAPLSMYSQIAGTDASGVLVTLELLQNVAEAGLQYELRTTVIPELTPDILLRMAKEIPPLPRYALQLYRHVNTTRREGDARLTEIYTPARLREAAAAIREFQPNVLVRA